MSRSRLCRCVGAGSLLLTLAVLGLLSAATTAKAPPRPVVVYGADGTATETLRWSTATGEQTVLAVDGNEKERWLVLTAPDGSMTRLGGGRTHPLGYWGREFELRDEATGWWIRYSLTTPDFTPPELTGDMSFREMLDRVNQARRDSNAETLGEIWTSDGIHVQLSSREGPSLYSEVAPILREKGLREGMPKTTQEAAKFLVRMRERNPHLDRSWESEFDFLGLLVDALDHSNDESGKASPAETQQGLDAG